MAPAVCVSSTGRAGGSGLSASFAAGGDDQGECVWTPTKSALSGTRHTDVTSFGASEDDGSALPRLVQSGNLSLEIWLSNGCRLSHEVHVERFVDLSEREILALAIFSEEEDSKIYRGFAGGLREQYPASAQVFDEMADEEVRHRTMLFDLYRSKFGDFLPLTAVRASPSVTLPFGLLGYPWGILATTPNSPSIAIRGDNARDVDGRAVHTR
jgi:hypothetical protein